jgi:hypothetical protein
MYQRRLAEWYDSRFESERFIYRNGPHAWWNNPLLERARTWHSNRTGIQSWWGRFLGLEEPEVNYTLSHKAQFGARSIRGPHLTPWRIAHALYCYVTVLRWHSQVSHPRWYSLRTQRHHEGERHLLECLTAHCRAKWNDEIAVLPLTCVETKGNWRIDSGQAFVNCTPLWPCISASSLQGQKRWLCLSSG